MPPVDIILLRGLAREVGHWGDFYNLLKQQSFVSNLEAIDLMGAGAFNKLTSPISIQENAEFVLSQWKKKSDRPQVLVSVSLGSMVAVEMAKLQPDRFAKIFVMNTSFANLSPVYHRLQLKALKRFYLIGRAKNSLQREEEILKMVSNDPEKRALIAPQWAALADKRPMALSNIIRQLLAATLYRLPDKAPETPIVVFNSLRDQMVDPRCSEKLSQHWSLPLYSHPSAGHDLCIDDPHWVISMIEKNLD